MIEENIVPPIQVSVLHPAFSGKGGELGTEWGSRMEIQSAFFPHVRNDRGKRNYDYLEGPHSGYPIPLASGLRDRSFPESGLGQSAAYYECGICAGCLHDKRRG